MAAAMNGMALHGGVIPYSGTFLVFSDYCRPSIRLAALMGERVIHVMTHDSIGLGEDGPTHEPVEHLAALRAIPNLLRVPPLRRGRDAGVLAARAGKPRRPERARADAAEPAAAAQGVRRREPLRGRRLRDRPGRTARPTCRCSRPARKSRSRSRRRSCSTQRGVCGARRLGAVLRAVRRRRRGDAPQRHRRRKVNVAVEAAVRQGWDAIIGSDGVFVGMTGFGASAPYKDLYRHFGITRREGRRGGVEQAGK